MITLITNVLIFILATFIYVWMFALFYSPAIILFCILLDMRSHTGEGTVEKAVYAFLGVIITALSLLYCFVMTTLIMSV